MSLSVILSCQCSDELYCLLDQSGVAIGGASNAHVNMRQSETVTVSLFFPPPRPHTINLTAPTHEHFVLSPVLLASRDQDGSPSNSTIDIHDLTEK